MEEVKPPSIAECEPWPLIKLLDFEKDVTGMFMSGHPLDNFSFQLKHYGLTPVNEFNEFKEAVSFQPNFGRTFRLAGLVSEAQHRVSKNGNKYGVLHIEDYSGKMELMLFGDDYIKYLNYFETGMIIYLTGAFRERYEKFDFRINQITLLESLMKNYTRKLQIEAEPKDISTEFIDFISENVAQFPGKSSLKFCINDTTSKLKFAMYTIENGFEMNAEMATYLQHKPEFDVMVELT